MYSLTVTLVATDINENFGVPVLRKRLELVKTFNINDDAATIETMGSSQFSLDCICSDFFTVTLKKSGTVRG